MHGGCKKMGPGDFNKLQFRDGNPGAVQYGNFINYYQFHPPDERIKLLPKNIWSIGGTVAALGIGCNVGILTVALKNFLMENVSEDTSILGIDIDPMLIQRAEELISRTTSFHCLDIMDETTRNIFINKYLQSLNLNKFSVVFCFSTTMWIHLNYGDSGLKSFLHYICSIAEIVVVEPQPWKCYKTAVKRMKPTNFTFPTFSEIKFRENVESDIENILSKDCNMIKVTESERTVWERKLLIFKHKK